MGKDGLYKEGIERKVLKEQGLFKQRNRKIIQRCYLLFLFIASSFFYHCSSTQKIKARPLSAQNLHKHKAPLLLRPLDAWLTLHRKKLTHLDGPRCPLYPSCSSYAQTAIRRYGISGFLSILERLVYRESGKMYLKYIPSSKGSPHNPRFYDPPEESLPFFGPKKRPSFLRENFPKKFPERKWPLPKIVK